ncbi:hypothetical protein QYM36_008483 [Artemia franciscana]|uniref:Uncharacterized protein n=2 Tax=Artemia franciscana TaxID=6661 RepID=A0AA88IV93_ARTSF|nr:hypothetical protein QYM36_008483 [Artemia franciscana]
MDKCLREDDHKDAKFSSKKMNKPKQANEARAPEKSIFRPSKNETIKCSDQIFATKTNILDSQKIQMTKAETNEKNSEKKNASEKESTTEKKNAVEKANGTEKENKTENENVVEKKMYTIEWTIEFLITLFATLKKLPPKLEAVIFGNSLHDAAMTGDLKICHELVSKGVPIDTLDRWERTALYYAVISRQLDVTQYLLAKGANPNAKTTYLSETILQTAAMNGCLDICRLLVAKGATINARALYYAVKSNRLNVTGYLLENGANLNAKHLVRYIPFDRDIPFNRETVLHTAVRVATLEMCQLLVAKGATVDALDSGDRTPLYYAITLEKLDVTRYLLEIGANPNANCAYVFRHRMVKCRLLHVAARLGNLDICQLLVSKGADVNCLNSNDETPLMIVLRNYLSLRRQCTLWRILDTLKNPFSSRNHPQNHLAIDEYFSKNMVISKQKKDVKDEYKNHLYLITSKLERQKLTGSTQLTICTVLVASAAWALVVKYAVGLAWYKVEQNFFTCYK